MNFLTIFRVTEILCSFKLGETGKEKTVKEIPEPEWSRLEFLGKFSANNFALSDAEDNTSRPLNRRAIADLPLLRTLLAIRQKLQEPSFWEVMDYFVLLAYASFKNPFATIASLSELHFRSRRFILLVQKKWFLWTMAAAPAAGKHGDEWGLIWYFLWGIYTSIPTWTHSQNSLVAAEAPSLMISSDGTSLKWSQRPSESAHE